MGGKQSKAETYYNYNDNGCVFSRNADFKGRFRSGGFYNNNGVLMGKIEQDGKFYNASDSYLGKVDTDGSVYDATDTYVGKVESNSKVYDNNGELIGELPGAKKEQIAYLYFFL